MRFPVCLLLAGVSVLGCAREQGAVVQDSVAASAPAASPSVAASTVAVRDASGRELGALTVSETPSGIMAAGTLSGLAPGVHGIHFHMTGRCEPPFESAGGHWNPMSKQHGTENTAGPHLGDLANITVAADSTVSVSVISPGGTLRGTNALFDADGAALVVHAAADDNKTDPSGNSGDRIACGVVGG